MTDTQVSSDRGKNSANSDGRIGFSSKKNLTDHGSCGCFAVGSGNGNGIVVVVHDLSKQFCTGEHWQSLGSGLCKFRIIRMDCGCVDNQINAGNDIFSTLSIKNLCTFGCEHAGKIGFFCIGPGNRKAFFQKNFSESAHADSANSDKVNMNGVIKF